MRRRWLPAAGTAALAVAALGCGGTSLDQVTRDYEKQSGLTFRDCGWVGTDCPADGPLEEAATQCMLDGAARCDAVKGRYTRSTIEGDPIVTAAYVEPRTGASGTQDPACRIVEFVDTNKDSYRGSSSRGISQGTCTRVKRLGCHGFALDGCQAAQSL